MKRLIVEPCSELKGNVSISGAKNSSLPLLSAACLADDVVTLSGIPDIYDVKVITEIMKDIGLKVTKEASGELVLDPRPIHNTFVEPKKASSFRASYYFVGALLAKFGKVTIGFPGGDDFVSRPIDQHIKALEAMGATFTFHADYYVVQAAQLRGADIYFDTITSGATINAMLCAVRAKGTTWLRNAAQDPEVVDTANLLNQMGARIYGAGTDTIRIEGTDALSGCNYTVIPDRLIAGTFMMAVGAVGGQVTIQNVIPKHMGATISKLQEIGIEMDISDEQITVYSPPRLKAIRVRTAMYPGFATDLQQPLTAMLLRGSGTSIVTDQVYPKRFGHVPQLRKLGADIEVRGNSAFIKGGVPLHGGQVHATDVRAGIALIIAGMLAEGETILSGVHHIERGYEQAVEQFQALGANIRIVNDDSGWDFIPANA